MTEKYYRLRQPLFSWPDLAQKSRSSRDIILAYDVIYNLLFTPDDIVPEHIDMNARAVLGFLGTKIEQSVGEEIFDTIDDAQLSFDLEADSGKV